MSEATRQATKAKADAEATANGLVGIGEFREDTGLYESYGGVSFGAVIGRNVKRLREERVLTQHELAQLWQRHGLNWVRSKVSALEAGKRPHVDGEDLVIMAGSMGVPLAELFVGPSLGKVDLKPDPNAVEVKGSQLHDFFAGGHDLELAVGQPRPMQADIDLARRIGIQPSEVAKAAILLFAGRTLTEERDRRVERMGDLTLQERQAHRGHVTRELSVQLEEVLNAKKGGKS
jgi:transcriptional regulator with XRE-family HTH domain